MSNDAARHELADVLALAQEQMDDLVAIQRKRAALTGSATVADGTVEVHVNAQGLITRTVIDESYLTEFDFADLGDHITQAAQAAAQDVGRRSAAMLEPMRERRKKFPSLSSIVDGAPDFRDFLPDLTIKPPAPDVPTAPSRPDEGWDDGPSSYSPTVRR
ncbi:MAG: YbaB/EbfC family nucleoid-associated protein [Mycobacterium sp.]